MILMCACSNVSRCHRSAVADYLRAHCGAVVEHLEPGAKPGKPQPELQL
ncbi:MAG: hypothetical protein H7A21_06625 [Spirochaetales bacterium]|nr:hypothetical protein [Spirochaetales bacterium]